MLRNRGERYPGSCQAVHGRHRIAGRATLMCDQRSGDGVHRPSARRLVAATLFCIAFAVASSAPADAKAASVADGRAAAALVTTDAGVVRGASAPGGYVFRGLP